MLKASLLNSASEGRDHVLYFPETDTGLTVADCGREMKENEVQVVGLRVRQPPRTDSFVNLWIPNPMCELEQVQSPHSSLEWGACCITLFQVPIWMTVFTFCRLMLHKLSKPQLCHL